MKIEIISTDVIFSGISEIVYEISVNNFHHYYIRKSVYDNINNGTYYMLFVDSDLKIICVDGLEVSKLTDMIY